MLSLLQVIDGLPWLMALPALMLGLAPFYPEPHVIEKVQDGASLGFDWFAHNNEKASDDVRGNAASSYRCIRPDNARNSTHRHCCEDPA